MIVRRVVVGVVVAAGVVAAGTSVAAATTQHGTPASAELGRSAKNTKPLTKAQFITQANALCDATAAAFVPVAQQFANIKTNHSPQELAAFMAAYAPIVQHQINQTRALKPPKQDQSKIMKMLQESQTTLNAIKANPQLLGGAQSAVLAADTLARAYGLEGAPGSGPCTKGGGGASSSTPASS